MKISGMVVIYIFRNKKKENKTIKDQEMFAQLEEKMLKMREIQKIEKREK